MNKSGQVLIIALAILLFISILLPALVKYTQHESAWTLKQQRNTRAFQLAEGAVERGYQQLLISTSSWYDLQAGTPVSGLHFDQTYTVGTGESFQILITSGPSTQQATITGVGRSEGGGGGTIEIRGVRAVYSNSTSGNNAITAGNTVTIGASVNVEWGAVISYTNIVAGGRAHPRFYSAGNVDLDGNGSTPPNTDNLQWWSYQTNLPSQPQVDLQYYKTLAQGYGANLHAGCPAYYNNPGSGVNTNITGCEDPDGRTYYFETGDWTWKNPGPNFIYGNVIIATGNMSISGNGGTGSASGSYSTPIPPQAWKEYANDWATYKCMDSYANTNYPTYTNALNASYSCTTNANIPNGCINGAGSVLVHGFVYAGGGAGLNGGGNARFHGVVITPNTVTVNTSNYTIYFDNSVAATVRTKTLSLTRSSWKDVAGCNWPSASGPAYCP